MPDQTFGVAPGLWDICECSRCGCLYLPVRPSEAAIGKAYADYYTHKPPADPLGEPKGEKRKRRRRAELTYLQDVWGYSPLGETVGRQARLEEERMRGLDRLVRHLPAKAGGRLLDVGCGNGTFLKLMGRLGWDATGVEPDPRSREIAIQAGLNVAGSRVEDLGPGSFDFDAITLDHVIEHVHRPKELLEGLWGRLRPGGVLWLATPNPKSAGHERYGAHWFPLQPPTHLALTPRKALNALLERAGIEGAVEFPVTYEAKWCFAKSARLQAGGNPFDEAALGYLDVRRARKAAKSANRQTRLHPHLGEEVILRIQKTG